MNLAAALLAFVAGIAGILTFAYYAGRYVVEHDVAPVTAGLGTAAGIMLIVLVSACSSAFFIVRDLD